MFYKFYIVFVYLTIHDTIRYTIHKNEKMIHDTIHDLTRFYNYVCNLLNYYLPLTGKKKKKRTEETLPKTFNSLAYILMNLVLL